MARLFLKRRPTTRSSKIMSQCSREALAWQNDSEAGREACFTMLLHWETQRKRGKKCTTNSKGILSIRETPVAQRSQGVSGLILLATIKFDYLRFLDFWSPTDNFTDQLRSRGMGEQILYTPSPPQKKQPSRGGGCIKDGGVQDSYSMGIQNTVGPSRITQVIPRYFSGQEGAIFPGDYAYFLPKICLV